MGGAAGQAQAGAPAAGSGGQSEPGPSACSPPSKDGPLSGSRDCTAECATGKVPCEGKCAGEVAPGGCTNSQYTLNVADADFSFVLDAGAAYNFYLVSGVCARLTAMPGSGASMGGKACASACVYDPQPELLHVTVKAMAWVRAETASSPLPCAP